jgi:hypothetical protein
MRYNDWHLRPDFGPTLRAYADGFEALFGGGTGLTKIVTSPPRYTVVSFLMILHAMRDPADPVSGASLTRIQDLMARTGLASRGRVAAILGTLRASKNVAAVPVPGDRRRLRLEPTPKLMAMRAAWLGLYLDAADRLVPGCDYRHHFEADGELGWIWQRHQARRQAELAGQPQPHPDLMAFVARDGGQMVLSALVAGADADGHIAMPYSSAPRRFGLSRRHLTNVIVDLAKAGLIHIEAQGGQSLRLSQDFRSRYEEMMGTLFGEMAALFDAAIAERATSPDPAPPSA